MSDAHRSHQEPQNRLNALIERLMPAPKPAAQLPVRPERFDRLISALEHLDLWVCEFDNEGRMLYASANVESILGFSVEECLHQSLEIHPDDLPSILDAGRQVRTTGEPARNAVRTLHKQGHWIWIDSCILGWYPTEGGDFHTITLNRDITELKNAEAAHEESETRRNAIAEMSWDLISEIGRDGQPTYMSPGCEQVLGYTPEELMTFSAWSLIHPEDEARLASEIAEEFASKDKGLRSERITSRTPLQCRLRHRDGHWVWLESLGIPYTRADGEIRYAAVSRDVTTRREAEETQRKFEESLQRSQKLESLGVLAGGIAHDFNNLLTPILGAARLGLEDLPPDSPVRERLHKIQQAAKRAAALTNQMLSYAGQSPLRVERIDLSALVSEIQALVSSSVSGKATFNLELQSELPVIEAEAAQISQVVMNLVTNAAESQSDGEGKITVRTGVVDLETPPAGALFAETMETGQHVYLEVTDTGAGMDEETRGLIFDPFFTTKFAGRGLGLAAVAGIVRAHRGAIEVESELERGTCFRVLLPAVSGKATQTPLDTAPTEGWQPTGTALVIDDDAGVRELAEDVLHRAGMTVLSAADGHEGVKLFKMHADRICVVLLDRTMPSLSGSDTFDAIRATKPDAKIVLISGYSQERVAEELASRSPSGFLKKPFAPEALLARVREVLEGPA
ncbi:MAG: PAS domain S-box protein [Myxococcota bacterium]|nr:PAS domain S-box protein [Myxococcota bacterium]